MGCVWGLMRMLYFRRDPKFLLDTKQLSGRHAHAFREINGKFSLLTIVTMIYFTTSNSMGHNYLSSTSSLQKMSSNFRCDHSVRFTLSSMKMPQYATTLCLFAFICWLY